MTDTNVAAPAVVEPVPAPAPVVAPPPVPAPVVPAAAPVAAPASPAPAAPSQAPAKPEVVKAEELETADPAPVRLRVTVKGACQIHKGQIIEGIEQVFEVDEEFELTDPDTISDLLRRELAIEA